MTKHVLTGGLIAGLVAGLFAVLLQLTFVVPLLLEGELYESGDRVHFGTGGPESIAGAPAIDGEMMRHAGTLAMSLVSWIGFALLLVVGFALAARAGHSVDARKGAIWGLAGFIAVALAPAMGLAPELPGTIAAELGARQIWWSATVVLTAGGLAAFAFGKGPVAVFAGAVAIALPHIVGAPTLDTYFGVSPPELSAHFAARVLAVSAAIWVFLGAVAGWLWARPAPA
ncbi:CbtA family protein [Jannaschia rubra]|uniref:CbtA family protein n=1 Tax=Jannaschia rubra TaxID=282197 RepID=UPI0024936DD0|nr:CbtA family protein [Jannaschia rubra]